MNDERERIIVQIKAKDYGKVRSLFTPLAEYQPMCTAVLDGIWPGQIWSDSLESPQSAMLITFLSGGGAAWCFLVGKPKNVGFNALLNQMLFDEKVAGKEVGTFLLTCSPENWRGQLETVGKPRQPAPMYRQHYVCRELTYNWRSNIPDGHTILPMKPDLLKHEKMQIPSQVKSTLGEWLTIKDERFDDYGFVVVYENQVVAWATVDFVTSSSGDLGFETLPEFRRQGLGSLSAAAALEHGLKMGIAVHWTCAIDNIGSQKTAKKLGLAHERDYIMYLFSLDVSEHMAQLAYSYLARGEHRRAIDYYEQLFAQKTDIPAWAYFDNAQAWAALRERANAIKYLRMAAKEGWSAVDATEKTSEFQILHDLSEWTDVIERIRQNKK
jgi:RimJ/RimL family protein N-acetyltransferase